ncbi:hypothetical protein FJM67_10155 [Maribrevibacterium harenarium]|uniref:FAD/FMN-containing dehydrogenase n=1 Tax=Maribrevibacterium harenarium TaxID=2589817 RepID=A0A501WPX8_9GAMM|nr:hypothetical protein [Maribrevibacterium harenarium]TPE50912.1 hypothetical protein FJM67_10155 [Maribrevibacterium harenarium]
MKALCSLILGGAVVLSSGCATAPQPVANASYVDLKGISDQHGNSFAFAEQMQTLIFVRDMDAKDLVDESLSNVNRQCLKVGQVVYLADISGMPSLIANFIAIPKMRDYDYPIWLDTEGDVSASLAAREDQVTLFAVSQGDFTNTEFVATETQLTEKLQALCGVN